ncbi:lysophospholipase-like protein 1 [Halyomorpha halys]|uniref:lysophospholipase-like protein 1 n=1 Tax=Halyomorpha halys TaxID=286706 RepID=UPI0006D4E167|nr:lysophospholipase-like protein 1 [Halyomorpha halys]
MSAIACVIVCFLSIYCCKPHEEITDVFEPESPTAALIFLHGAGESGSEIRRLVERLSGGFSKYSNLRIIFPTAGAKSFSPFPWNGQVVNIWYNFDSLDIATKENVTQIGESASVIERIIEEQVLAGIPHKNICVAGFSSGGLMSLHLGYEYIKDLGCIGAMSAFLPTSSALYKKLIDQGNEVENDLPPLFISGGILDFFILPKWMKTTIDAFQSGGVNVTSVSQLEASHFLTMKSVGSFFDFVQQAIL